MPEEKTENSLRNQSTHFDKNYSLKVDFSTSATTIAGQEPPGAKNVEKSENCKNSTVG